MLIIHVDLILIFFKYFYPLTINNTEIVIGGKVTQGVLCTWVYCFHFTLKHQGKATKSNWCHGLVSDR